MAVNPRDIEEELQDLQVHIPDDMSVFSDATLPLDEAELAQQENDGKTQADIVQLQATVATLPLLIQQMQELQRELKLQSEARAAADRRNEQLSVQLSEQQRITATLTEQLAQTQTEQQRAREAQVAAEAAQKLAIENEAKLAREERARAEATRLAADKEREKQRLADLNKRIGPNGETRLHLAAKAKDLQNVASLLDAKADPNIADNQQNTPLGAAWYGNDGCFQVLLAHGANPYVVLTTAQEIGPFNRPGRFLNLIEYASRDNKLLLTEIQKHYKPRPHSQ